MTAPPEPRVLVCAPTGRDGPLICSALAREKVPGENLPSVRRLCAQLSDAVGAVIIAEEALDEDAMHALLGALGDQPPWSDVPVLLLTGGEGVRELRGSRPAVLDQLNVTLVERPLAISTFMAAVRAALRARGRQYALRETLLQVKGQAAELRQAAEDRARLLDSERAARQIAEEANSAKDDFLAVVSHELRTPLSAILGWTNLLAKDRVPEGRRAHAVEVIGRNARAQAQLVEDLLDISRITSGKFALERVRVDLGQIVHTTVDTVRLAAEARRISLRVRAAAVVIHVQGDAPRLQQVIWNLLHNAIKFTAPGGEVRLELTADAGHVAIAVCDTGRGIGAEFLPHVFDRFRQAETPTTRSTGGLGLGLAICRQIVELHGGSIEARSEGDGRGATFIVRLPEAPVGIALASSTAVGLPESVLAQTSLDGVHVLVVDDDLDTRELVRSAFEDCRAEVSEAGSVAEALHLIGSRMPDVLISDVAMPGEDGYSLVRKLRERSGSGAALLPAVALTAFARDEDRRQALEAGFHVHIPKPIDPGALVLAVSGLIADADRADVGRPGVATKHF